MQYISTRGNAPKVDFEQATMTGLAPDGGLYVPETWPVFDTQKLRSLQTPNPPNYPNLMSQVVHKFIEPSKKDNLILFTQLPEIYARYTHKFNHSEIAPLKQLDPSLHVLELFHGPTLAFKDFALQFLGPLIKHFLNQRSARCTIIGATSGDTGSAAIEAVRGLDRITLYMLHPEGRVSEIQRRQMTTVTDANIHNLAVDGNFDDCQNLVKAMFNDADFRERHALTAVNSINWARIAAQTVYYFHAALALGAPEQVQAVNFAVPTGNFGNVFAAYAARKMGLPINRLIIGSNSNDILTRFFETGKMARRDVHETISPSMDIQISSNFERYLFELLDRDADRTRDFMTQFAERGEFSVGDELHRKAKKLFSARRISEDGTYAEIKHVYEQTGMILDPHTAIGVAAARKFAEPGVPTVALATAHPAKFPKAVARACGVKPPMPPALQNIMRRKEKMLPVKNDLEAVKAIIDRDAEQGHS